MITLDDLDYRLPPEQIAQEPVSPRDRARLLVLERTSGRLRDLVFSELPGALRPHDLLVVNDSRVVPARVRGRKRSGGQVELLLLEWTADARWRALLRTRGKLRAGLELVLGDPAEDWRGVLEEVEADGTCVLRFDPGPGGASPAEIPDRLGEIPLPPYIRAGRARDSDREDYQTVLADPPGSVAAPTASLHFTPELVERLPVARLTLHVGPGTFRPIRTPRVGDHHLEAERFEIGAECERAMCEARSRGGRVIAVGTTVVRALESTQGRAGSGRTDLFIQPGHRFRAVDSLITNFHLPRSSLLALVMALGGVDRVKQAYRHAVERGYRFYSYGDALWIV